MTEEDNDKLPPGRRILCISDTHGKHDLIKTMPPADILIHAGDYSSTGTMGDIKSFVDWFDSQEYADKIFISGNHETSIDTDYYVARGAMRFHSKFFRDNNIDPLTYSQHCRNLLFSGSSSTYLENSSTVIGGEDDETSVSIYGSPYSPEFCDWAFNLSYGEESYNMWHRIPINTDVLITHGPPLGYGDQCVNGLKSGCRELLNNIQSREDPPRVHIFGHIHEDYGLDVIFLKIKSSPIVLIFIVRCTTSRALVRWKDAFCKRINLQFSISS
jgi:predicted phosphodiesterase